MLLFWCGAIYAAVLKGCIPLLLLRHEVMQTSSQLLTQEAPMEHHNLMTQTETHFIHFIVMLPFWPMWTLSSTQLVYICGRKEKKPKLNFEEI